MAIVLFAILGAHAQVGVAYWICFGVFCAIKVGQVVYNMVKESNS